jgi:hypothetical protein
VAVKRHQVLDVIQKASDTGIRDDRPTVGNGLRGHRYFSEMHLRRVLSAYASYYNQARTHLALQKDAPLHRAVQRSGTILAIPILAGLHHQYGRI